MPKRTLRKYTARTRRRLLILVNPKVSAGGSWWALVHLSKSRGRTMLLFRRKLDARRYLAMTYGGTDLVQLRRVTVSP